MGALGPYELLHVVGYAAFTLTLLPAPCSKRHVFALLVLLVASDTVLAHVLQRVVEGGIGLLFTEGTWSVRPPYWGSPLIFSALAATYGISLRLPGCSLDWICRSWLLANMAFKLACFTNDCCGGSRILSSLSLIVGSRHPSQLYEAALSLFLALTLIVLDVRGLCRNRSFLILGAVYGVGRFLLEFTRATNKFPVIGLSLSQALSLTIGVSSAAWFLVLQARQRSSVRGSSPRVSWERGATARVES